MSDRIQFPIGINILIIRDGKLLLGKRKGSYGAGMWGLPGGHLEHDECMIDAAARELAEETGLTATYFEFVNLFNNHQGKEIMHYLQIGFIAHEVQNEPVLKEPNRCEEWRWFKLTDLPEDILLIHKPNIEGLINKTYFTE